MRYNQNGMALDLYEQERAAWANGDTARAAELARLADDNDELQRLRTLYWTLRDCFPIHSSDRKADILKQVTAVWEAIEYAGDVGDPD